MINNLKFKKTKDGPSKERCLEAFDHLKQNASFQYLIENMVEETRDRAVVNLRDMCVSHEDFQPLQGMVRILDEFIDLSRNAHKMRGQMNKEG